MNKIKTYLLSRSGSLSAWIGVCGFILEIFLHLGNVSTLMLVLFAVLVIVPEEKVREFFKKLTDEINP